MKLDSGLSWHEGLVQDVNEGPMELLAMVREYLESQGVWPDDNEASGAPGVTTPLGVPLGWTPEGHGPYNHGLLSQFGVSPHTTSTLVGMEWAFNHPALLKERRWEILGPNNCAQALPQWFLHGQPVAFLMEMTGRVVWRLRLADDGRNVSGHFMQLTTRQTALGTELEPGTWKTLMVHMGGIGTNQVIGALAVEASGRKFMLALKMQTLGRAGVQQGEPFFLIQALGLPEIFPEP